MNLQPASYRAAVNADLHLGTDTRLQGRWLALIRLACIVLSVLAFMIFIASLPVFFADQQKSYTPGYAAFLLTLGILVTLVWFIVTVLIFWRKSNDWLAFLVSLMLVFQSAGTTIYSLNTIPSLWLVPAVILNMLAFLLLFLGLGTLVGDVSHLPTALQVYVNIIQILVLIFCLGFFLVTFSNGRFVPHWSWLIGCTLVVQGIFFMLPGPFNTLSRPLPLILIELVFAYTGPIAILVYRYRRIYIQAQCRQTRWVIFGLICFLLVFFLAITMSAIPMVGVGSSLLYLAQKLLMPLAFLLIPLSVTIAIMRSRLWDIDVIIRRTLVYSTLTVILALLYLGLVIGLTSLVRLFTGQAGQSSVIIVASTFAIAALFQPLRHCIQTIIDRRFYRRKYDAAKTVEAFSATLRNELDLTQLRQHLMTVVQDTMQPSHVSHWLRAPDRNPSHPDRM